MSEMKIRCNYGYSCDMINAIENISNALKQIGANVTVELENEEHDGYEVVIITKQ